MSTQVHANLTEKQVEQISADLDEPEWLLETRKDALAALDDLDMPDVITTPGPRHWTNLTDLDYESLVDPLEWAQEKDRVEAEGADVLAWDEALAEHGDLIEEHFGSVVDPQRDFLTALSTALFSAGTLVYIPEGVAAEDVKIRTTMNSRSLFNYTLVVAEESASATILERQSTGESVEGDQYYSGVVEVVAGENASVQTRGEFALTRGGGGNTERIKIRGNLTAESFNIPPGQSDKLNVTNKSTETAFDELAPVEGGIRQRIAGVRNRSLADTAPKQSTGIDLSGDETAVIDETTYVDGDVTVPCSASGCQN